MDGDNEELLTNPQKQIHSEISLKIVENAKKNLQMKFANGFLIMWVVPKFMPIVYRARTD